MTHRDANDKRIMVSKTVIKVFNAMPKNKLFYGWELKEWCVDSHPELASVYTDTFLRMIRKYFPSGYEVVSRSRSLYKKVAPQVLEKPPRTSKETEYERYRRFKQQSLFLELSHE